MGTRFGFERASSGERSVNFGRWAVDFLSDFYVLTPHLKVQDRSSGDSLLSLR
jgi:hypothetical protein